MLTWLHALRANACAACNKHNAAGSIAVCRWFSSQNLPQPTEIKLKRAQKRLDISFDDGRTFSLPAELLRVLSPSADTERKDSQGKVRVVSGRRHVNIMGLEPVGSYAVRVKFDDLHHAGIYSWSYLYDLGAHKLSHARAYLKRLQEAGLSREPPRSSKRRQSSSSGAQQQGQQQQGVHHGSSHSHDGCGANCSGHHH